METPTLHGKFVRLEPLGMEHVDDLVVASGADRSSYGFTTVPDTRDAMASYVEAKQADPGWIPFAQIRVADRRAVGTTSYLNIRFLAGARYPFAVEIGGTWLGRDVQRTAVNTEAKLLLMSHAFEVWGVARVDIKTDARNEPARRAIERLGARPEGVLRSWQPSLVPGEEGRLRDTAMYSVVAEEWPGVRDGLAARVNG